MGTIGEAGLNALFSATVPATTTIDYQCFQMAQVFWARGVQLTLKAGEFDKLFRNPNDMYNALKLEISPTPLGRLQPGDWANFMNAPDCPNRQWQNENVIVLGDGQYYGWGIGQDSHEGFRSRLLEIYNKAVRTRKVGSETSLKYVPGYQGQAWTLLFAKLGQTVFNSRTGQ